MKFVGDFLETIGFFGGIARNTMNDVLFLFLLELSENILRGFGKNFFFLNDCSCRKKNFEHFLKNWDYFFIIEYSESFSPKN